MQKLGKQIAITLIISALLASVIYILQQLEGTAKLIHSGVWGIMIFSVFLALIIVAMNSWGLKNLDPQSRTNLFLGTTVLRLILSMGFIGAALFLGIENQILWVANFFAIYLFYLVFEIYTILSNLRQISS
ncbi:MAG: xanthine/uracil permease [Roseivirga sp.]|jgi:xanthine/uracil permease